jgi:hypothetical protein
VSSSSDEGGFKRRKDKRRDKNRKRSRSRSRERRRDKKRDKKDKKAKVNDSPSSLFGCGV